MSQAAVVARLAMRELWITFRLLVVLVAFVGAGAVVALLPAPLPVTVARLAVGLGLAAAASAAVAAWCLAEERAAGRAGWLVTRSVSRSTLLVGWFVALGGATLVGAGAALLLGWLAVTAVALRPHPVAFALVGLHLAVAALAIVAAGMLAGILLPRVPAAVMAATFAAFLMAVAWLAAEAAWWTPGAPFLALASFREGGAALGESLRGIGAGLLVAAFLLVAGRVALERVEL